jgi:predicted nucleic acid-binding protein
VLVDTNVLVYAYDRSAPEKQKQALDLLDYLAMRGSGALTPQILAEFFVVVTRKMAAPLSEDFSDGSVVEGVRFVNPFTPTFQIADWAA